MRRLLLALGPCLLAVPAAAGSEGAPAPAVFSGTRRLVVGPQFRASGLHGLVFGDEHRELWTAEVELPVLDLAATAGSLTPVRRVGGQQTLGLGLKGGDGLSYTFRALVKDPSGALPPRLRESWAAELFRDQNAAAHPGGAVVAAELLAAAGVLHTDPVLVVMPDDPALGEFRAGFAGQAGTFEVYPTAGFAGSREIVDPEEFYRRIDGGGERADARAFLRARLMDFLLGDWDRHRRQWRWARIPGRDGWQPIPEDRDQAFVRFDGLALDLARKTRPQLVEFGPRYPAMEGLAFNGREQDRRLLAPLDRGDFEAEASDLVARLDDEVLARAVGRLPEAWRAADGSRLERELRARRDALPAAAQAFFRHLAREADVRLTEAAETVAIEHAPGELRVRASARAKEQWLDRRFRRPDTGEVRLYLAGGEDRVSVSGAGSGIEVRVIAGGAEDVVEDRSADGVRVYDDSGRARVAGGPATRAIRRPWTVPPPDPATPWVPHRDWGRRSMAWPWLSGGPDVGLFFGATWSETRWGFRSAPFRRRLTVSGGWATGAGEGRLRFDGEWHPENSTVALRLHAQASGVEILRYYGLGNETSRQGSDAFHRAVQREVRLRPALELGLAGRLRLALGPSIEYAAVDLDDGDRYIARVRPYGADGFGQAAAVAQLAWEAAPSDPDRPSALAVEAGASFHPALWDAERSFGEVHGAVRLRLGAGGPVALHLRAGAKRVWGDYPFHEAAYIGGADTVRGLRAQRFGGDAALWGGAEAHLRLGRFDFPVPTEFGAFLLADSGRVHLAGEDSGRWHAAAGGGLWLAPLDRTHEIAIAVARSRERTAVYFQSSLRF